MPTDTRIPIRESVLSCGVFLLYVAGLTMAIVGGLTAATVTFGIGLGICISLTLVGIWVRERNIAS
jgi:hypothetical protein